ncbi:MAG: hypothetical protein HRT93_02940 [Piscirickettsiaceae bacterium]|nr:hypothetical protein [Piscirickettsiaceae bacterium]
MAIGTVTPFNKFQGNLLKSAYRNWDDAASGNVMFVLADASYVINVTHQTVASLGANYISAGDGAPIEAGGVAVDDVITAGVAYLQSNAADFGSVVTIVAKYLIAVAPVVAGTLASTSRLLWYVDLDTSNSSAEVSSTDAAFKINQPTNGWASI